MMERELERRELEKLKKHKLDELDRISQRVTWLNGELNQYNTKYVQVLAELDVIDDRLEVLE